MKQLPIDVLILILLFLIFLLIILNIILIVSNRKQNRILNLTLSSEFDKMKQDNITVISSYINSLTNALSSNITQTSSIQTTYLDAMNKTLIDNATLDEIKFNNIRQSLDTRLDSLKSELQNQLSTIKSTVNEKLQDALDTRLSQSFNLVSSQLEQVNKGLGEMHSLASGVSDLKKVLSNVKTRGIFGENQLASILKEILTSDQYEENVETIKGTANRVEFAIKLPNNDDSFIYLPIDAKFPLETYSKLVDAYQSGNKEEIEKARKQFITRIKNEAKDINEKYIMVPSTTDFAIMFLPVESLYCEAINLDLFEFLQKEYKVTIAGPSTLAALLNALQMGFRTLAIQKRSSEVWQLLNEVKDEFEKFASTLQAVQNSLQSSSDELDKLVGTRTRSITKKLKEVQSLNLANNNYLHNESED